MQNQRRKFSVQSFLNLVHLKNLGMLFPYALLLFFLFSFTFQSDLSFNQDLGMHLTLGKIIWQTHAVPRINLFSYTNPNFPFINHHWLFEVLAYIGSISIGIESMLVLKIIILLISLGIVLLIAKSKNPVLLLPITFIFLHLMRDRVDLRPEIFSYLFTTVTLFIVDTFDKQNSKVIYMLPIISLLWVNTHIFFPVGIFLQSIFLTDVVIQKFIKKNNSEDTNKKFKTLLTVFSLSIVSTLLNPNFITGALYPFTVFNNYGVSIIENQPIFVRAAIDPKNHDYLFFYISMVIGIGALFVTLIKEKFSFKNISLILLGFALALQSIKGLPYLVFISLPFVLTCFDFIKNSIWIKILNGIIAILILIEASFYLSGVYYTLTYKPNSASLKAVADEKPAIDFLLKHNLPQPIYNTFGSGGYLLYRSDSKYKLFVDERPEAYPASFFQNIYFPMQRDYSFFKKEDKKYGFKTILFTITSQDTASVNLLSSLNHDQEWRMVFLDKYMVIFVKTTVQKDLDLPVIDLSKLNSNDYRYTNVASYNNLSEMLFNLQYLDEAKNFAQKALDLAPDNPAANNIMGTILTNEGTEANKINQYEIKSNSTVFW